MGYSVALLLAFFAGSCHTAPTSRIVGGNLASIENYPSLVQVDNLAGSFWMQSCAGNILNELYILTAAHCFAGRNYSPTFRRIRAGATYRNTGGVLASITTEFNHPDYGVAARYDADISVVRLSSFLTLTTTIQRANIPVQGSVIPADLSVWLAGWGTTVDGGPHSSVLLDAEVYTVSLDICSRLYATIRADITTNMICTTHLGVSDSGACDGDAGGPLLWGQATIGIISWGQGCGELFYPGVSTAVAPFTNWIVEIARRA